MIAIAKLSKLFYKLAKSHFSYDILNNLKTLTEKRKYLSKFFHVISSGSGRQVFIKNSKKVIKLAFDKSDIYQNETEANILKNNQLNFLPKFYNNAPDYSWIEVELVKPLEEPSEITNLIGINGKDFLNIIGQLSKSFNSISDYILYKINDYQQLIDDIGTKKHIYKNADKAIKEWNEDIKKWKSYLNNPYLFEIKDLIDKLNLKIWEFQFIFNLGKSASGHLVLLDIGKLNQ